MCLSNMIFISALNECTEYKFHVSVYDSQSIKKREYKKILKAIKIYYLLMHFFFNFVILKIDIDLNQVPRDTMPASLVCRAL